MRVPVAIGVVVSIVLGVGDAVAETRGEAIDAALNGGRLDDAHALGETWVHDEPDNMQARYGAALACYRGGWVPEARAHLEAGLAIGPDPLLAGFLAMIDLDEGDEASAQAIVDAMAGTEGGNIAVARDSLAENARARTGRADADAFAVGTPEAFIADLARSIADGASAEDVAMWFSPTLAPGYPEPEFRRLLTEFLGGALARIREVARPEREILGWYVEPSVHVLSDDPWVRLVIVVRQQTVAEDELLAVTSGVTLGPVTDPLIAKVREVTPADRRDDVLRRMLMRPMRKTFTFEFAVSTGAHPAILSVRLNGNELDGTLVTAMELGRKTAAERARRGHVGAIMSWLIAIVAFLGAGVGLGAWLWWRNDRERERRRAARMGGGY